MTYSRPWMFLGLTFMAAGAVLLWQQSDRSTATAEPAKTEKPADEAKPAADTKVAADAKESTDAKAAKDAKSPWKELFDGKSLDGWRVSDIGGEGKVSVKDGTLVLEMGSAMTAIAWKGEVLRNNYELTLEGMRLDGSDFFCTTTFPVGKEPCSLVVGGWGGGVVGLSNVDYFDASENSTTKVMEFKDKQWYRVRIRVSDAAIQAWIDNKLVVNQPRKGHKFGIRIEVNDCVPLGIATWYTKGAVRNIRMRPLKAEEVVAAAEELKTPDEDN